MERTKKIVIATPIYPPTPGGPATHAKRYVDYFLKNNIDAPVLSYGAMNDSQTVSLAIPFGFRHMRYVHRLYAISKNAQAILALDALGVGLPALIVSKIRRIPLLLRVGGDILWERSVSGGESTSMGIWYRRDKSRNIVFLLVRMVMRMSALIVVPSDMLKDLYVSSYGISEEKIIVLPNPLPQHTEVVPIETGFRDIVYASRFVAYKNLLRLIEAFEIVATDEYDARLVLFGQGEQLDVLRQKRENIFRQDIRNRVLIIEHAPAKERLGIMAGASLCVAPALTEFYPNYVMECLSFGVPFVISREHGLPFKVIEEAQFNPLSVDDMARAIARGLNAKDSMITEFSHIPDWDSYCRAIELLINDFKK
ncbi:MAG: glycosyltransferase family 4 protein [bacterium]|nr:glycosyltransferase family 4 protein [bacterium]